MTNDLVPGGGDGWDSYVPIAPTRHPYLCCTRGEWIVSATGEVLPHGTRFTAIMDDYTRGWVRWWDMVPTQRVMVNAKEGAPPKRETLGDQDKSQWSLNDKGEPEDPWQPTFNISLVAHPSMEVVYLYSTSSRGGIDCLEGLARTYAQHRRMDPNSYPVVALGASGYKSNRKGVGFVKTPTLAVCSWTPRIEADASGAPIEAEPAPAIAPPQSPAIEHQQAENAAKASKRQRPAAKAQPAQPAPAGRNDDDDVPW